MTQAWVKDPGEVLDYLFDFAALTNGTGGSDYLESGETILSQTVTASTGITVESIAVTHGATCVLFWLRGGTADVLYTVTVEIVTSNARIVKRSHTVRVRER
jgi:hypothetical protein